MRELKAHGHKVFLDMKLLDIDNTVASAVENIARMGMTMLTLHAYPKAMAAAVKAAEAVLKTHASGDLANDLVAKGIAEAKARLH